MKETEIDAGQGPTNPCAASKRRMLLSMAISLGSILVGLWLLKTCGSVTFDGPAQVNSVKLWGGMILAAGGLLFGLVAIGMCILRAARRQAQTRFEDLRSRLRSDSTRLRP